MTDDLIMSLKAEWECTEARVRILCHKAADALEAQAKRIAELEACVRLHQSATSSSGEAVDDLVSRIAEVEEATKWLCEEINRVADGERFSDLIRLDRAKTLSELGLDVLARHRINERFKGLEVDRGAANEAVAAADDLRGKWRCRAEKAETDLAAAREALLLTCNPFRTNSENLTIERAIAAARGENPKSDVCPSCHGKGMTVYNDCADECFTCGGTGKKETK